MAPSKYSLHQNVVVSNNLCRGVIEKLYQIAGRDELRSKRHVAE